MLAFVLSLSLLSADPNQVSDYLQHSIDVRPKALEAMTARVKELEQEHAMMRTARVDVLLGFRGNTPIIDSSPTFTPDQLKAKLAEIKQAKLKAKSLADPKQPFYAVMPAAPQIGSIGTFDKPIPVTEVLNDARAMMHWECNVKHVSVSGKKGSDGRLIKQELIEVKSCLVLVDVPTKGFKAGDLREIPGVWRIIGKDKVGIDTAWICQRVPDDELKPVK